MNSSGSSPMTRIIFLVKSNSFTTHVLWSIIELSHPYIYALLLYAIAYAQLLYTQLRACERRGL